MGLKIGVTTVGAPPGGEAALWSSGVTQNIVFLAQMLGRLPGVDLACLICCPGGAAADPLALAFGLPAIDEADAVERLDMIVELGARGRDEAMARFRDRGGRLVSYVAGNVMAMNFEALACGVPHGEMMSGAGFDAVWITPQHWRMNRGYARLTRSERVFPAPHIWSPACLDRSAALAGVDLRYRPPAEGRWRIGVFDPNVNVVKTFHLPLLVCEEGYRRAPERIDRVLLFGAAHLIETPHFKEFCGITRLAQAGRLFAEARFPLAEVLGRHVDVAVTHQWENNLNYLYWDILSNGWPLIHNSEAIAEAGYYYPDFDPQTGGEVLAAALETHRLRGGGPSPADREAVWRHSIDNPKVQAAYAALVEELM